MGADSPKTAPTPAPVGLEWLNTLDADSVVKHHMWQEYHWKAPKTKYLGHDEEDKKVAERLDADGDLVWKDFLNAAFCEWAMATVKIEKPDKQKMYMRWWLEDKDQNVLGEHPDFSKANFDAKNSKAEVKTAQYAWRWDGRKKNAAGRRVFARDETCWSMIELKSESGKTISAPAKEIAPIEVQGEPYKLWVLGVPKTDLELDAEKAGRGGGRWLGTDGAKLGSDCWIKVFRGVTAPVDEAYLVFLGHGAVEATGYGLDVAKGTTVVKHGAIATPHDREFKAWIQDRNWGGDAHVSLCQIANVAGLDGYITLDIMSDSAGNPLPPPNNPYCDTKKNQPFKDGVQGHRSFTQGGTFFLIDNASTGCTTIVNTSSGTRAKPAAVLGDVRSIRPSYGEYAGPTPDEGANKDKIWGPALEGGRPGTFYNKQNKRNSVADAALADDFPKPLIKVIAEDGKGDDEPLHMQPTFQHGLFGGFLGHEISWGMYVKDEPDEATNDDPKLRIRCKLLGAAENSKAFQYHRLVAFGHIASLVGGKVTVEMWVPRIVQRLWNGHIRNVMVKDTGMDHCEYAWFFEQRNSDGSKSNRGWIGTKPRAGKDLVLLDNLGKLTKEGLAKPTIDSPSGTGAGAQIFSVFKYRVKLLPAVAAGVSVWEALSAREDLFSDAANRAQVLAEKIVQVGADSFLEGQSEVRLTFI